MSSVVETVNRPDVASDNDRCRCCSRVGDLVVSLFDLLTVRRRVFATQEHHGSLASRIGASRVGNQTQGHLNSFSSSSSSSEVGTRDWHRLPRRLVQSVSSIENKGFRGGAIVGVASKQPNLTE